MLFGWLAIVGVSKIDLSTTGQIRFIQGKKHPKDPKVAHVSNIRVIFGSSLTLQSLRRSPVDPFFGDFAGAITIRFKMITIWTKTITLQHLISGQLILGAVT